MRIWNNYYDGCAKYGVGVTSGASAFVEGNFFRDAKDPMMSSQQGTDGKGEGTFSGENGGVIKSYANVYAMYSYTPLQATAVPSHVTGFYGAGRANHGDFKWDFSGKDSDASVDTALKTALQSYQSAYQGGFE